MGQITELKAEVKALTTDNTTLKGNNRALEDVLDLQNEKVREFAEKQRDLQEQAKNAAADAEKRAKAWKSKYDAVLQAPGKTGDGCFDLNTKINEYLELRQKENDNESVPVAANPDFAVGLPYRAAGAQDRDQDRAGADAGSVQGGVPRQAEGTGAHAEHQHRTVRQGVRRLAGLGSMENLRLPA